VSFTQGWGVTGYMALRGLIEILVIKIGNCNSLHQKTK